MVNQIGFRPTKEDYKKIEELKKSLQKNQIGKITNSDLIRYAISKLHEELKGDERN